MACNTRDAPYSFAQSTMTQVAKAPSKKRAVSAAGRETRRRICLAAEALIGKQGPEAVTLKEIGSAAGQRNRSAVAYHFGDKANLINEVIRMRNSEMEEERQALLDAAQAQGRTDDLLTLVRCLYQPILSVVDDQGIHRYSRFQLQILSSQYVKTPIDDRYFREFPARIAIIKLLEKRIKSRSSVEYGYKVVMASTIFHSCVKMCDDHHVAFSQFANLEQAVESAYDLMCKTFQSAPWGA